MELLNNRVRPLYLRYLSAAFVVSVSLGMVISGALILLLPLFAGASSLWLAMPITELPVAVYVLWAMRKYTRAL